MSRWAGLILQPFTYTPNLTSYCFSPPHHRCSRRILRQEKEIKKKFTLLFVLWEVFSRLCWHRVFVYMFLHHWLSSRLRLSTVLPNLKNLPIWRDTKAYVKNICAIENWLNRSSSNTKSLLRTRCTRNRLTFYYYFILLIFLIIDPTDTFGFQQKPDGCFIINFNVCFRTFLKNLCWRYNIQQLSTQNCWWQRSFVAVGMWDCVKVRSGGCKTRVG